MGAVGFGFSLIAVIVLGYLEAWLIHKVILKPNSKEDQSDDQEGRRLKRINE